MDPLSSYLLESLDQAASTRSRMSWHTRAQPTLHPGKSLHSAQPSLHPSKSLQSTIRANRSRVANKVDGEDSRCHQHPRSSQLNCNLMHKFILLLILSPGCDTVPVERCAPRQPGRVYHSTHEDRRDFPAARALWGIKGRWSIQQA